jgi:hypothetical protein
MRPTFYRIVYAALGLRHYAEAEIASLKQFGFGKWLLDLSVTSIVGLLMTVPVDQPTTFRVTADDSAPLRAMGSILRERTSRKSTATRSPA